MTMANISGVIPLFVFGCNNDDDNEDGEDYPNALLLMHDDYNEDVVEEFPNC